MQPCQRWTVNFSESPLEADADLNAQRQSKIIDLADVNENKVKFCKLSFLIISRNFGTHWKIFFVALDLISFAKTHLLQEKTFPYQFWNNGDGKVQSLILFLRIKRMDLHLFKVHQLDPAVMSQQVFVNKSYLSIFDKEQEVL